MGAVVDDLNVFNLPYVFRDTAHAQKVMDGEIGKELLDKVTNSGRGLIGLSWISQSAVLTPSSRGRCSPAFSRSKGVGS